MEKLRWMLMAAVIGTAVTGMGQETGKEANSSSKAVAQEQDERTFFVSFVARELDENGKVVNSRRYDTMTNLKSNHSPIASIRTGAKVPIAVVIAGKSSENYEVTYVDVGVSFDVDRPRVVDGNRLAMQVNAEISSLDPATKDSNKPTIRQNRWVGNVQVPIGEHKVIFSSDDLVSKRTMQIEVTVTPVR